MNIEDTKRYCLVRDNYRCQRCGAPAVHLAHKIAQTKANIKKFGKEVIHHPLNLVSVCTNSGCNDWFNIGFKTIEAHSLARRIEQKILEEKYVKAEEQGV